jgi:hypothetical protein
MHFAARSPHGRHIAPACSRSRCTSSALLHFGGAHLRKPERSRQFDSGFQRQVIFDLETAVRESLPRAQPWHSGCEACVRQGRFNRRILVRTARSRGRRTPVDRVWDEPEGTNDPPSLVSF